MSRLETLKSIFTENWTSVFNTILGRNLNITISDMAEKDGTEINEIASKFQNCVELFYSDSAEDRLLVWASNKMISIISNLMIGIDTFKDEINDDDRDAFTEAINQMFSSCQVPIKEDLGVDVKFRDITFKSAEELVEFWITKKIYIFNFTIDIENTAKEDFLFVSVKDFSKEPEMEIPVQDEPLVQEEVVKNISDNLTTGLQGTNIDMILDVELPVTIRIGSTEMKLIDIMRLGLGSIIELEKLVDDPVDVLVNNKLVARGEVVVYDGNFAIRVVDVQSKAERIKSLA